MILDLQKSPAHRIADEKAPQKFSKKISLPLCEYWTVPPIVTVLLEGASIVHYIITFP